eukprot:215444-Ditylum_brightwellii.AAC.1
MLHHIKSLYIAKGQMSAQDRHTFHPDLHDWPTQLLTAMNYWITRKNQTSDTRKYIKTTQKTRLPKTSPKKVTKANALQQRKCSMETQGIRKYGTVTHKAHQERSISTTTSGLTEYYTLQGCPSDRSKLDHQIQTKLQDFFKPTTSL